MKIHKGDHARLQVTHSTRFDYSEAVLLAYNEVRMTPMKTGLQDVLDSQIQINCGDKNNAGENTQISPITAIAHRDHFANIVHHFDIAAPHHYLEIVSKATIETTHAICCGPEIELDSRPYRQQWAEFLAWSPGVPKLDEYNSVPHAQKIHMDMDAQEFEAVLVDVIGYFSRTFRFDPDVTHVYSSPADIFKQGGGVCQDMAHALIGVLRTAKIPARYVSGYIYDPDTDKDEGSHLRGAAASHAWVQAWHDKFGWIGVDPTNDKLVDWQYIRTAIGRDYFDVPPVRGLFRGNAEQSMQVNVQVIRLD
ncbi:MAG: transglutaminase family protein [Mariprofundaceae bacterium]